MNTRWLASSPLPGLMGLGGVLGVRGLMKGTCALIAAEELSNMASELAKYDLQLPAFSKIGGILANELSVDEAAGRDQAHLLASFRGYGSTLSLTPPYKLWLPLIIGRAIRLPDLPGLVDRKRVMSEWSAADCAVAGLGFALAS